MLPSRSTVVRYVVSLAVEITGLTIAIRAVCGLISFARCFRVVL